MRATLSAFVGRMHQAGTAPRRKWRRRCSAAAALTPENARLPTTSVGLLRTEFHDTVDFPLLRQPRLCRGRRRCVPAPGQRAVARPRLAEDRHDDDPHSVCGIAGYLRKKDGGFIAFAVIVTRPAHEAVPL